MTKPLRLSIKVLRPLPTTIGRITSDHGLSRRYIRRTWIGVAIGLTFGAIPIGFGVMAARLKHNPAPASMVATLCILGSVFPLLAAYKLREWWTNRERTVYLGTEGIAQYRYGRITAMRWNEISEVQSDVRNLFVNGVHVNTVGLVRIWSSDSSDELRLSTIIDGFDQIRATLDNHVVPRLTAVAIERIHAGANFEFAPVIVDRDGLRHGRKRLRWSAVTNVEVRQGWLRIHGRPNIRIRWGATRNAPVLAAVIAEMRKAN